MVIAIAATLAGCGSSSPTGGAGSLLYVYTDLPLVGPQSNVMVSIYDGELLALGGGQIRIDGTHHQIVLELLEDGTGAGWDSPDTMGSATTAAQNTSAVAYIGDFDSGATATSLPITNPAHLLQVSPASPYVGLTDQSVYDTKGEPFSYYPSGTQTFARLVPTDVQEALATVRFMRSLGVKRLFTLSDTAPYASYDSVIATMVAADAKQAGITLAGSGQFNSSTSTSSTDYASVAGAVAASAPDAVFVGAAPDAGVEALWQELYSELPGVKLFAPSTLATNTFVSSLGPAGLGSTYVTSPILPLRQYGPQAKRVLRAYTREFSTAPTAWSLYGYEAMESVIAAIKQAGARGHAITARAVVRAYFHLPPRYSVLGLYRIKRSGDTTRSRFVGYQVETNVFGQPQLYEIRSHLNGG